MDDRKITLLETTFAEVKRVQESAAALFYERLFINDPSLRRLFTSADMSAQGRKLTAALALAVGSLRRLDTLVPALENLAVKHVDYGVERQHYDIVGRALIETLSLYFGARFTSDVRAAWLEAYNLVAGVMTSAAYGEMEAVPA